MPAPRDFLGVRGPLDIVGDVHGCAEELDDLVEALGYVRGSGHHPRGRRLVFAGDLCDRGPDTPGVFRRAMAWAADDGALCVMGNHEHRLRRHLRGHRVALTYGLDRTVAQLGAHPPSLSEAVCTYLGGLPGHLLLDGGDLVVAHAGLPACLQGEVGGRARAFAMYGPNSGALPADHPEGGENWACRYEGRAHVVHGHHPVRALGWRGRVLNLDTGCVFGGRLSALRYPEMELISVPARATYAEEVRWSLHLEQGLRLRPT